MQIQLNLRERTVPYFVGHLRAHTQLPGPLSEGSAKEDLYTRKVGKSYTGKIGQTISFFPSSK